MTESPDPSHVCTNRVPVCPGCGRVYEYLVRWKDGTVVYESKVVRDRYVAMYGEPTSFRFEEVGARG